MGRLDNANSIALGGRHQDIDLLIHQLAMVATHAAAVMRAVDSGQGVLGRLVFSRDLAREVDALAADLTEGGRAQILFPSTRAALVWGESSRARRPAPSRNAIACSCRGRFIRTSAIIPITRRRRQRPRPARPPPRPPPPPTPPRADESARAAHGSDARRQSRRGNAILTIILVAFALLVLGIASCAISLMKAKAKVEAACDAYLANAQAERYDAAYDAVTPAWRAAQDRAAFAAMEKEVRRIMGTLVSKSETGFFESTVNSSTTATIGYDVQWQRAIRN